MDPSVLETFPDPNAKREPQYLHHVFDSAVKQAFSKTNFQRKYFFDYDLRTGSWSEFCSRLILGSDLCRVAAIYSFFNFNIWNKLTYQNVNRKHRRVYTCVLCERFELEFKCVNPDQPKEEQLWQFLSGESRVNDPCTCFRQVDDKKKKLTVYDVAVANHPGVRAIVRKGAILNIPTLLHEVKTFLSGLGIPIAFKQVHKTSLQQIVQQLQFIYVQQQRFLYNCLPRYLHHFSTLNDDTSVALQADQNEQFYRLFVGFPIAKHYGRLTVPILSVDSFHYQSKQYDGVAVVLTSKTGFGRNIMLAFAIIPVEDTNNMAWFLQMCTRHHIDFSTSPLFTDQGPLLSAVRQLAFHQNYQINIILCLQHLIRNVKHKFPIFFDVTPGSSDVITNVLQEVQAVPTMILFFDLITQMLHGQARVHNKAISDVVDLGLYILQYHPSHWTVFANCAEFEEEGYDDMRRLVISDLHSSKCITESLAIKPCRNITDVSDLVQESNQHGRTFANEYTSKAIHNNPRKCPLFHVSKTNMAESTAALMLRCGGRHHIPPLSIMYYFEQYNIQATRLAQDLMQHHLEKVILTTIGNQVRAQSEIGHVPASFTHQTGHSAECVNNNLQSRIQSSTNSTESELGSNDDQEDAATIDGAETLTGNQTNHNNFTTATGIFGGSEQSTYKATLTWYHNDGNDTPRSDFMFQHTCERHVKLSCMMLCPCQCIEQITEYAKDNCETWPWPTSDKISCLKFFPHCMQSEENFHYLHHEPEPGQPSVLANLFLSVPSYEDARDLSKYKPNPIDSQFSSVDFDQPFQSAPKYRDGFSGRRFRSKGEPKNSSARVYSKKNNNTSSGREGKRKLLSDASIVSSQPASRNKGTLSKLAADQGQLRFEDDETRKLVAQTIRPQSGKKCSICRQTFCDQSRCTKFFAWGNDPMDRKSLIPCSYWIYELPPSTMNRNPPIEFRPGITPILEATEGLDTHFHDQPFDESLDEKSRKMSTERLQWKAYNERNSRRQLFLQGPKRRNLQPTDKTKKTYSLYEDVDRKYLKQYDDRGQVANQRDESFPNLLAEKPFVTPLQCVAFSSRVPQIAFFAKALNGASKKASIKYPLKTIVVKAFNGVFHEGEVTAYDDDDDLYQIVYQDGDTEQLDPSDLGRYRKKEQMYSTSTENVYNLPTNNGLSQNLTPGSLGDTLTPLQSQKSPDAVSDLMKGRSFNPTRLFNNNQEVQNQDQKDNDGLNELARLFADSANNDDNSLSRPFFESTKKKKPNLDLNRMKKILLDSSKKPAAKRRKRSSAFAQSWAKMKKPATAATAAQSLARKKKPAAAVGVQNLVSPTYQNEGKKKKPATAAVKSGARKKKPAAAVGVQNLVSPTYQNEGSDSDEDNIPLSELVKEGVKAPSKDGPGNFDKKPAAVKANDESACSSSDDNSHDPSECSYDPSECTVYGAGTIPDFIEVGTEVRWTTKSSSSISESTWSGTVVGWDTKTNCPVIEHDEYSGVNRADITYGKVPDTFGLGLKGKAQPTPDTLLRKKTSDANCGREEKDCSTRQRCHRWGRLCKKYVMKRVPEDRTCFDAVTLERSNRTAKTRARYEVCKQEMEVVQKVAFQQIMAGDDVRNDAEAVDSVNMEAVNDHTAQVARVEVFNELLHSKCEDFNLLTFPFLNPINCGAIDDAATNLTELEEGRYPRTGRSEDRNRTTITVGNWNRLAPGRDDASHFNDTLIDFWITWITREYSVGRKTTHDILIVNSHTFQLLADAAYNKDMSSLAVFKKNDIFKKKLVLFPIQQHNHWSLCVLVNPGKVLAGDKVDKNGQFKRAEIDVTLPFPCMLYLDPLPGQHDSEKNSEIIRTWLNVHWAYHLKGTKNPFNKGTYPLYKPTVPSQSNYTDCGVFVCRYIFAVYKLRALTFSYEDARVGPVPGPRDVQPACEVCWQKLHHSPPFQFDGTDITRIRAEIQTLIMNLFHLNNKWNINLN